MSKQTVTTDEYFGGCPECGKQEGMIFIGKDNWFYCSTHKACWTIGNVFSGGKSQSREEQRRIYDALGFGEFTEVEPILPSAEKIAAMMAGNKPIEPPPF